MPTVRKIANPDATTNDEGRTTTGHEALSKAHPGVHSAMAEHRQLPQGWAWSTLGEISGVNVRDTALRDLSDSLPVAFVPMAAVDAESGTITAPEERLLAQVRKGFTSFSEGDVLFAKITPCMENGKAAIAKGLTSGRGFGSTEFHVLKPRADILPEWIFYFVRQESFRKDAKANFTGTAGQLRVPASFLENYPVPVAPLAEQRRIVEAIEQQFTRLDVGVASLRRAQAELRRYRAAVLKAACEGRLVPQDPGDEPTDALLRRILDERRTKWEAEQIAKMQAQGRMILDDGWRAKYQEPQMPDTAGLPDLPQGWVWATVEQVADVETGATPLRSRKIYYSGGTIPWVTSGALNKLLIEDADEFITQLAIDETNAKIIPAGSLLVAMYGEGKTRGKVSELRIDAATNQACAALIFPDSSKVCRSYVKIFFQKNYEDIRRLSSGGVQPNLNLSIIKQTFVPLPSLAEQQRIVAEVERRLSVVAEVEAAVAANLKRAERLRQAILKRAFEGKLVPQDPSDEPASALLERIRKEREGQSGKKGVKQARMQGM